MTNRTITFAPWTDDAQESLVLFVMLYTAFMGTADNPNRARSLEETRTALKVLEAIDAISETTNSGQPSEFRRLKDEGGVLVLDPTMWALLQRCVDAWVGSVPFAAAKQAMALKTLVDEAPEK